MKPSAQESAKFSAVNMAVLRGLRGRVAETLDGVLTELIRRYIASQIEAITAVDCLKRMDKNVTKLVQRAEEEDGGGDDENDSDGAPPTYQVQ